MGESCTEKQAREISSHRRVSGRRTVCFRPAPPCAVRGSFRLKQGPRYPEDAHAVAAMPPLFTVSYAPGPGWLRVGHPSWARRPRKFSAIRESTSCHPGSVRAPQAARRNPDRGHRHRARGPARVRRRRRRHGPSGWRALDLLPAEGGRVAQCLELRHAYAGPGAVGCLARGGRHRGGGDGEDARVLEPPVRVAGDPRGGSVPGEGVPTAPCPGEKDRHAGLPVTAVALQSRAVAGDVPAA